MTMLVPTRTRTILLVALLVGCTGPESCKDDPFDPDLSLESNRGVTDVTPRQLNIKVGQTATVLALTKTLGAVPRVSSRDPSVATAQVTGTEPGATSAGRATVAITGVQEGQTVIEVLGPSDPAGTPPITVTVQVSSVVVAVALTPDFIALAPGESRKLDCAVTVDGSPVANPNVTFTSSDVAVAGVAPDGTVTGIAEGDATIVCALPTGESASSQVQVRTPPTPMVPSVSQLPGTYSLNGSVQSNTCPAGLFPTTITNPGTIAVQVVGTGQNPPVSIGSTTTVTGIFNSMTGAFSGSGLTTVPFNGVSYTLVEMINGVWSISTTAVPGQFDVFLNGTVSFNATPSGGTSCNIVYGATYQRRIVP
jgi:hypothetical protein